MNLLSLTESLLRISTRRSGSSSCVSSAPGLLSCLLQLLRTQKICKDMHQTFQFPERPNKISWWHRVWNEWGILEIILTYESLLGFDSDDLLLCSQGWQSRSYDPGGVGLVVLAKCGRLVLRCIDADFCNWMFISQRFSKYTRFTTCGPLQIQIFSNTPPTFVRLLNWYIWQTSKS